jgi:hypothetical protein
MYGTSAVLKRLLLFLVVLGLVLSMLAVGAAAPR